MPQTSQADIIVTDLSSHPATVVGNTNSSFLIDNLPGLGAGQAQLRFQGDARATRPATSHSVRASRVGSGFLRLATDKQGFVLPVAAGLTWMQVVGLGLPGQSSITGFAAVANMNMHNPNSFDNMYMLFKFKDNSLPGSPVRYAWLNYSVANANGVPPTVTIFRYAYDDSGAFIAAGVVPEPASLSLLALGALTLGAKGLRSWRRNRPATNQP